MTMAFTPEVNTEYGVPPWSTLVDRSAVMNDPRTVAARFSYRILAPNVPLGELRLRDDTYTDTNTGVMHVYLEQFAQGRKILNAGINVNIKNWEVVSYGNSVSALPSSPRQSAAVSHLRRCYFSDSADTACAALHGRRPATPQFCGCSARLLLRA